MGISIPQLLIILLIVALLFGTKKLRSIGSDLGSALKGFRSAMKDDDHDAGKKEEAAPEALEGEVDQDEPHRAERHEEKV